MPAVAPMEWLARLWARIWDPVATPSGAALMAIVGHLIRRFRERMVALRWSLSHQSVAISASDETFGKVDVLYNGAPAQNLSMCYLEIENESSKDLSDLDFAVSYADGTSFLISVASLRSAKQLALSSDYANAMTQWMALPQPEKASSPMLQILTKSREYRVPVLNRGAKVDFAALVQVPPGVVPTATVTCVHKGVRLRHRAPSPMLFGVSQNHATLIGFALGLAAILLLRFSGYEGTGPVLLAFLAGAAVMLLGAAVIHLMRLISRMLG